ncbi:MAG: MFS transporter [Deltaproteobacteria bacterium]|nr:MFS transporter [Deltaproteobacteria bacterium]
MDEPAHAPPVEESAPPSERRVILLLAMVQFVNILDFMMPSPLGPRFAAELDIETSSLGLVVASYTLAAGAAGLVGAFFLDRFDRRAALSVCLAGLAFGTAGAVFATNLETLVLARVIAGAFGGPATSVAMAIIADLVPVSRRGRALGTVMMAFSLASVFGVPMGLVLAGWGSWHTPFVVTGALCLVAALAARTQLPPLRGHIRDVPGDQAHSEMIASFRALLTDPAVRLSYGMALVSAFGAFMLIPNIASFVQNNFGYPEALLSILYGAGGIASLLVLRPLGKLVDRVGSFPISLGGAIGYAIVCWLCFIALPPWIHALCAVEEEIAGVPFSWGWVVVTLLFVLFMLTSNARNVAFGTLSSRVPPPALRARYQSLSSMVQHVGLAAGGLAGPVLLSSRPDGSLVGIDRVAWLSIATLLAVPWLIRVVEGLIDRRDGVRRAPVVARAQAEP